MNDWLKSCVFNLDLSRAKYEKVLPPLEDFAILGTTKSPGFCNLGEWVGL